MTLVLTEGVYVDLIENPERFTGYAGPSSSRVWKAIYEENCFAPVPFIDPSRPTFEGGSGFAHVPIGGPQSGFGGLAMGGWGEAEKRLMGSLAGPKDPTEEVCLEKRVFYRVISGTRAVFSLCILSIPRLCVLTYKSFRACRSSRIHLGAHLRRLPRPADWIMGTLSSRRPLG